MSGDFETWLAHMLPTGTCPLLTPRELELMQNAFDAGWDIQRRAKLIPVELCREVRRSGMYFNNKLAKLMPTSRRLARSPRRCRQCGQRLHAGSGIRWKHSFIGYRAPGCTHAPQSVVYIHAHDCGDPDESHERTGA